VAERLCRVTQQPVKVAFLNTELFATVAEAYALAECGDGSTTTWDLNRPSSG